jgi:hypothetical protein
VAGLEDRVSNLGNAAEADRGRPGQLDRSNSRLNFKVMLRSRSG